MRKSMTQSQHERYNRKHYPGTRQMCAECDEPTGRTVEDGLTNKKGQWVCPECYKESEADDEV